MTPDTYPQLLKNVRFELKKGIENIRRLAERERVKAYWQIGRHIENYFSRTRLDHFKRAEVLRQLSKDLNTHLRSIQHALQFAQAYPRPDFDKALSWSHYRYLLTISSPGERKKWEARILKEKISSRVLLSFLTQNEEKPSIGQMKEPVRGRLYTYRIIKASYVQDNPSQMLLDCGFETRIIPPPSTGTLSNTRMAVSTRDDQGKYSLKLTNTPTDQIYTYSAIVERVVDGDTLLVNIDVGFGIWKRERLRLNAIDAPEKQTIEGLRTCRWLEAELQKCAFVVIKTSKSDKYDRYLTDLFYKEGEHDPQKVADSGTYLNHKMVKEGYAQIWQG